MLVWQLPVICGKSCEFPAYPSHPTEIKDANLLPLLLLTTNEI